MNRIISQIKITGRYGRCKSRREGKQRRQKKERKAAKGNKVQPERCRSGEITNLERIRIRINSVWTQWYTAVAYCYLESRIELFLFGPPLSSVVDVVYRILCFKFCDAPLICQSWHINHPRWKSLSWTTERWTKPLWRLSMILLCSVLA